MDKEQQIFGLMAVTKKQQEMVDEAIKAFHTERMALREERQALVKNLERAQKEALRTLSDSASSATREALKPFERSSREIRRFFYIVLIGCLFTSASAVMVLLGSI